MTYTVVTRSIVTVAFDRRNCPRTVNHQRPDGFCMNALVPEKKIRLEGDKDLPWGNYQLT